VDRPSALFILHLPHFFSQQCKPVMFYLLTIHHCDFYFFALYETAPPMFGRATITLGIGPHSSSVFLLSSFLWPPYVIGQAIYIFILSFVVAALCNRGPLYFCSVISFYLSIFFFSSPNLSGRRLDVYHTLSHGVALVRI